MFRFFFTLMMPALLLLTAAPASIQVASAQVGTAQRYKTRDSISGAYISELSGQRCYAYRNPRGFTLVDEVGNMAYFVVSGRRQLKMVGGVKPVTVTVSWERGHTVLTFEAPGVAPASWVSDDRL